ncbi:hypothetical protein [Candidatus Tisiphia endosymbiont of Nemotelus uliginosus]|uniref:hypothetical protein n=1 Tax=Candidatus Tisiphia endosymbiont of Nemotelus uliginosus TaxID=3077926 RepID=UPI0035C8B231
MNPFIEKANVAADNVIRHKNGEKLSIVELSQFQEINQSQHNLLVTKIREKNAHINAPQAINTLNHYMRENWLERLGISKAIEGTETEAKKGVPWKEGEPSLVTLPQGVLQNIGKFIQYNQIKPSPKPKRNESPTSTPPTRVQEGPHAAKETGRRSSASSPSTSSKGNGRRGV